MLLQLDQVHYFALCNGGVNMKRVTRNNLLKFVEMRKEYEKSNDIALLDIIYDFIENVINKDKRYYSKLSTYNFDSETLKYLM